MEVALPIHLMGSFGNVLYIVVDDKQYKSFEYLSYVADPIPPRELNKGLSQLWEALVV